MSFRDSILRIAPPWLQAYVGSRLLYIDGILLDSITDWLSSGVKARFPDEAPEDALGYIGNDRSLEQGPAEPVAHFRTRLREAVDTLKNAGGGRTLLSELAAHFDGIGEPPMRLVSDSSVWHEYNWGTGLTTRTKVTPSNWLWDLEAGFRWWRGWVIIDSSGGPWGTYDWDDPDKTWDEPSLTWDSTATPDDVEGVRRIVRRWKPENVDGHIIVTFDASLFERTDASPPNPNSEYGFYELRNTNAAYWELEPQSLPLPPADVSVTVRPHVPTVFITVVDPTLVVS